MNLQDKRIIVTGAGAGIGAAIATVLATQGARVVLTDLTEDRLTGAKTQTGAVLAVAGDLTEESAVHRIFETAVAELGGVDGLVNNAGAPDVMGRSRNQSLADWSRIVDVNLKTTFLTCRQAGRVMREGGAIVNIASVAGLCAFPASNAYSVSKAGVVMMTRTVALDLARDNIRVNAIAPGLIDAPMAYTIMKEGDETYRRMQQRIPMGRLGLSSEIAAAAAFLLSDAASYITGTVLPVDGGWTAFGGPGNASAPEQMEVN